MHRKEIIYDRDTGDYAMYLDGELVGYAHTFHEAEITLDQLVFELAAGQYFREADDSSQTPDPPKPPKKPRKKKS